MDRQKHKRTEPIKEIFFYILTAVSRSTISYVAKQVAEQNNMPVAL